MRNNYHKFNISGNKIIKKFASKFRGIQNYVKTNYILECLQMIYTYRFVTKAFLIFPLKNTFWSPAIPSSLFLCTNYGDFFYPLASIFLLSPPLGVVILSSISSKQFLQENVFVILECRSSHFQQKRIFFLKATKIAAYSDVTITDLIKFIDLSLTNIRLHVSQNSNSNIEYCLLKSL